MKYILIPCIALLMIILCSCSMSMSGSVDTFFDPTIRVNAEEKK